MTTDSRCASRFVLAIVFSLLGICAHADDRVTISNTDPAWGDTIIVSYVAPASSVFAHPGEYDTLFVALEIQGSRPDHWLVCAMRHVRDSLYEAHAIVPDSTRSIRVEVCTPDDRVPDGITEFTCRTAAHLPARGTLLAISTNIDSTLRADLALYPKDYASIAMACAEAQDFARQKFAGWTDSAARRMREHWIAQITSSPDTTLSWWLACASLHRSIGDDSLAGEEMRHAALCTQYDDIVNDQGFWRGFFRYSFGKRGLSLPYTPGRLIAPLVARWPRSCMAVEWITVMQWDSLVPADQWNAVANAWADAHDVDVLQCIATGYANAGSAVSNPGKALQWVNKTEASWRTKATFYSGENIFGSMGRIDHILALKIAVLGRLGRMDEATATARVGAAAVSGAGVPPVEAARRKQRIGAALAHAWLLSGNIDEAERAYGKALALSTSIHVDGVDSLFTVRHVGDETLKEFAARLAKKYGGEETLPRIPDFEYQTMEGEHGTLQELRGKVAVIDCWFISCPGCVIEHESLNRLVDSFHGDTNVVFLSIALDSREALKRYGERTVSKFKIVPDGQTICDAIGVMGFPTHIIISRTGTTLGYSMGGSESEGESMRPKIEAALRGE